MKDWSGYYKRVGEKPNSLVIDVLRDHVQNRDAALDLGAGNLRDSKFLLKSGFKRVVAVDESPDSKAYQVEGIDLHIAAIEQYVPEANTFDYAICCNTLFFLSVFGAKKVLDSVRRALKLDGILACNLLGESDGWVTGGNPNIDFVMKNDLTMLQEGWKTITCADNCWVDKGTNKVWHTWCLVLQKL